MVPSWTETLLQCGINVVGRTRFCIHPSSRVAQIPVVGGTKDINWEKVLALKPDVLLLDKEENTEEMFLRSPCETVVTHVDKLQSMPSQLAILADRMGASGDGLRKMSFEFEQILSSRPLPWAKLPERIPGEIQLICREVQDLDRLVYVIWKDPWMSISPQTYIGSVLDYLGAGNFLVASENKYPQIDFKSYDLQRTYFLFSSEPYPFLKKKSELAGLGLQGCFVDGESYSWFGSRSLRFLQTVRAF